MSLVCVRTERRELVEGKAITLANGRIIQRRCAGPLQRGVKVSSSVTRAGRMTSWRLRDADALVIESTTSKRKLRWPQFPILTARMAAELASSQCQETGHHSISVATRKGCVKEAQAIFP